MKNEAALNVYILRKNIISRCEFLHELPEQLKNEKKRSTREIENIKKQTFLQI